MDDYVKQIKETKEKKNRLSKSNRAHTAYPITSQKSFHVLLKQFNRYPVRRINYWYSNEQDLGQYLHFTAAVRRERTTECN